MGRQQVSSFVIACALGLPLIAAVSPGSGNVFAASGDDPIGTVDPARVLDTRSNGSTVDGRSEGTGPISGGTFSTVRIASRGSVPADAEGAILNLAAIRPSRRGFATLYPCSSEPPTAASLNFDAGQNISNATTVKLSSSGDVCLFSSATSDFAIDVVGFIPSGSELGTVDPVRLLDTRSTASTIDGISQRGGAVSARNNVKVEIAGRGNVPDGAGAAIINLAAIGPSSRGYATLYPCTSTPPTAASLNFEARQNISNATMVKLSSTGEICVYTSAKAHFAIDVVGYLPAGSEVGTVNPSRLLDTRSNGSTVDGEEEGEGAIPRDRFRRIQIGGRGSVPADASGAVLNLAAIQPSSGGFATLYPCTSSRPTAASLNFASGQNISNATTVKLNDDGEVCIYTSAQSHFTLDVLGYIATPGTPAEALRLPRSESCVMSDTEGVLGNVYTDVLVCDNRFNDEGLAEYNLGTRHSEFNGFIGVPDDNRSDTVTRVTISLDGTELYRGDLRLGDQIPLDLDVTGGLRLRIDTKYISGRYYGEVVFTGRFDSGRTGQEIIGSPAGPRGTASLESRRLPNSESCVLSDTEGILGNVYTDVLVCDNRFNDEGLAEYNLGTRHSEFNGFIGVPDDNRSGTVTRVTISLDGEKLFEADVTLGDQIPLDLDVTGGLRLRIDTKYISGAYYGEVVIAGRLDGTQSSLDIVGPPASPAGRTGSEQIRLPNSESCVQKDTTTVLGVTYTDLLVCDNRFNDEGLAEYNLGTRFTTLEGFIAVPDDAPAATVTRVTISLDGAQLFQRDLTLGDRIPLNLDISDGLRLRLDTKYISGGTYGEIVFSGEMDS